MTDALLNLCSLFAMSRTEQNLFGRSVKERIENKQSLIHPLSHAQTDALRGSLLSNPASANIIQ